MPAVGGRGGRIGSGEPGKAGRERHGDDEGFGGRARQGGEGGVEIIAGAGEPGESGGRRSAGRPDDGPSWDCCAGGDDAQIDLYGFGS